MKTTRLISTREQRRSNTSTGSNGMRICVFPLRAVFFLREQRRRNTSTGSNGMRICVFPLRAVFFLALLM